MSETNLPILSIVRDPKTLGELVRARRKAARLTQAQAAGLAGVGNRFLSELERGKKTLELGLVLQVLERLGFELAVAPRGNNVLARLAREVAEQGGPSDKGQVDASDPRSREEQQEAVTRTEATGAGARRAQATRARVEAANDAKRARTTNSTHRTGRTARGSRVRSWPRAKTKPKRGRRRG